jgi:trk system potassium uptake protein TrkA
MGGGNVGRYVSLELLERGHQVTLVERDPSVIDSLADCGLRMELGDACSPLVLERAGVRQADVAVAATGDDEDNLVISLLSKEEFAVPRVLARINHPTNEWLFDESWGVDQALSPPHLLTSFVEEEVTAGDLVSLLKLERGQVELLEVRLSPTSAGVGHRIEELDLPPDVTLVAVVRHGHVTPARGKTPLEEGDEVIALAAGDRHDELRRLLVGGVQPAGRGTPIQA